MEQTTLRDLRDQSKLTLEEIVRRMRAVESDVPQFPPGIIHLEKRGTDRISILRALAAAYEVPLDTVFVAASNSRKKYQEALPKKSVSS